MSKAPSSFEFEWDERNLHHIMIESPHGLDPAIVERVGAREPRLFPNRAGEGRSGSHVMIGPDQHGQRFWTVVLLERGRDRWRPITGWPSTNTEIRLYKQEVD